MVFNNISSMNNMSAREMLFLRVNVQNQSFCTHPQKASNPTLIAVLAATHYFYSQDVPLQAPLLGVEHPLQLERDRT